VRGDGAQPSRANRNGIRKFLVATEEGFGAILFDPPRARQIVSFILRPRNSIVTELYLDGGSGVGLGSFRVTTHNTYAFIMKIKLLVGAALLAGISTINAAEFNAQAFAINVRSDPKNAPAIVAMAVVDNPKAVSRIVTAGVKALPKQAVSIVKAALRVDPKQAVSIVKAAILAEPRLAVEITNAATATLPGQSAEITKAAEAVAPEDLKESIAGSGSDGGTDNLGESKVSGGSPPAPSFPSQPVQPDLVSPSS
jgi:hypothetical protein